MDGLEHPILRTLEGFLLLLEFLSPRLPKAHTTCQKMFLFRAGERFRALKTDRRAGTDERVAGLVYIAAAAPYVRETVQSQLDKYPTEIFSQIEVAGGR